MADSDSGQQLEQLEKKMDQAEAEARTLKLTGRLMTVAVAVVAIVMVLVLIAPFNTARKNPQPYLDELTERSKERLAPRLRAESDELVKSLRPVMQEVWAELQTERLPALVAQAEAQGRDLVTMLATDFQVELEEFREEMTEKQLAKMRENVPELDDTDRIERLFVAAQNVSDRMVNDLFHQHFDALNRLDVAFNSITVPDDMMAYSPAEIESHMTALLTEYIGYQLRDLRIEGLPMMQESEAAPAVALAE